MSATQSLLERVKAKRQTFAAKSNTLKPIKLASAKNMVRILPNWAGDPNGEFYHDFAQHYIKDAAGKVAAVYVCVQGTFGKECDICNELAGIMAQTTDEAAIEKLKECRANTRILVNAIVPTGTHSGAKTDPALLDLPQSVFDEMLGAMVNAQENDDTNIFDLDTGHDFTVEKTGSGRDTRYSVNLGLKPRKIDPAVLTKCVNISEYVQQEYEAGKLKAIAQLRTAAAQLGLSSAPSATLLPGPNANFSTPGGGRAAATLASTAPADLDALEGTATVVTKPAAATPAPASTVAAAAVTVEDPAVGAEVDELEALLAEMDK